MELVYELSSPSSRRNNLRSLHIGVPSLLREPERCLQLAAASYIYILVHYALKKKRKERRWWQTQLYTSTEMYSGSSLSADLNFQSVR